jgi:hypothetical protein
LKALDQVSTEFADFTGEAIMYLPDLDPRMVNPRPAFGIGGRGLPFAPERFAFAAVLRVFAIAELP